MASFIPVTTEAEFEGAIASSHERPVLFFKHSHTCGLSAQAFDELDAWLAEASDDPHVYIVTVQTHRHLSNELVKRFNVRHETPQVLLVRNGACVWHGAHFRVTSRTVRSAYEKAA
jgi:bacillithiol system protein YtxJ